MTTCPSPVFGTRQPWLQWNNWRMFLQRELAWGEVPLLYLWKFMKRTDIGFFLKNTNRNLGAIWKLHLRPLKRESRTRSSQEECQAAKPPTRSQPRSRPAQLLQLPRPRPAQHLQQQLPRSPSVWSRRGGPSHPLPRQEVLRPEKLLPLSVSLWSCWLCCSPPSHSPSSYVAGSSRTQLTSLPKRIWIFMNFSPKKASLTHIICFVGGSVNWRSDKAGWGQKSFSKYFFFLLIFCSWSGEAKDFVLKIFLTFPVPDQLSRWDRVWWDPVFHRPMSTTPIAPLQGTPSTRRSTRRWTRRSTRRSRSFTSNPGPPGPKKSSEWTWTGTTSTPNKSSLTDNHQIRKWIFFFLPETITFELFNMIYILRFNSDKIEKCNCVCYILSVTEHLLYFPSGSAQWWSSLNARPEILSMVQGYWLHPINIYK